MPAPIQVASACPSVPLTTHSHRDLRATPRSRQHPQLATRAPSDPTKATMQRSCKAQEPHSPAALPPCTLAMDETSSHGSRGASPLPPRQPPTLTPLRIFILSRARIAARGRMTCHPQPHPQLPSSRGHPHLEVPAHSTRGRSSGRLRALTWRQTRPKRVAWGRRPDGGGRAPR